LSHSASPGIFFRKIPVFLFHQLLKYECQFFFLLLLQFNTGIELRALYLLSRCPIT
jgi:hypothetical protein